MDTKTQSLPITHTQPHSSSRPQSHTCNPCTCGHHCQSCSQSCSRGQGCATGHCSQSPSPNPPRPHKHTMHSRHCPTRPTTHSCSYSKSRKNLKRKADKRKTVKRSQRVYKTERWSSGRKHN
ncbi:PREDICTED: nuclear transition protein 2 [Ceratotherium simum simum]|uniref:Nuclear transition protein 2 n=1 Tax=Ceratotherium simum simum TaxID=73337 RepID=A0ABM1DAU2_CERSS|nr:PREDICTED: nuclear transition protein 2 [Ceratotherium simum simum]